VNRALVFLARSSPAGNARVNIGAPELLARTYCASDTEFQDLIFGLLLGQGMVQRADATSKMVLSPKGYLAADDLEYQKVNSAQGFVAMSFGKEMDPAWSDGFRQGIEAAGYRPLRIDHKEHINGISDEIVAEIRRSRFVVTDYTHQRNGVYYEAGFASGLGLPLIPTCRADQIKDLHFDIAHINTLRWNDPKQLAIDLARRISAVIGDGPLRKLQADGGRGD
jgi:nucleoside 2-deoxyribosyltransferase